MKIKELRNKKIAILGFGLEGKSTLSFLLKLGVKDITILDKYKINKPYNKIKIINGIHYLDNLGVFDIIIKSPGISPYNPKILPFIDKLTSQTEIFLNNYKGKVIGITGTKGKSTIASLIYKILKSAGYKVKLVGNIGKPVLDKVNLLKVNDSETSSEGQVRISSLKGGMINFKGQEDYDFIVYELSSYMLEGFTPKLYIGVLNNIFPDHMNWHNNSFKTYKKAKENILINSKNKIDGRKLKLKEIFETNLKGKHNQKNINIVKEICNILQISKDIFYNTIKSFKPLKHRLENIGKYKGIIFIDDAISTTPESTIEAIKTFGDNIGTIFLGGLDRGYNFNNLIKYLSKYNIKNIVLFPESGNKIKKKLDKSYNILETKSMKKAISFAFTNTKKGNICLLSTASPSYNLWKNYKKQGENFKNQILNYINLYKT